MTYHRSVILMLLLLTLILAACGGGGTDPADVVAELPDGDPVRGAALYVEAINGAPTCQSCHALDESSGGVGPSLGGYAERAANEVSGQNAEVYTYIAIIKPADHIVDGYGNLMYTEYRSKLEARDIADLIAFLLQQ